MKRLLVALLFLSLRLNANAIMQNEIEHVVVVMLENRSLDNALAWLYSQDNPPLVVIPEGSNPLFDGLDAATFSKYSNELYDKSGNLIFSSAPIQGTPSIAASPYLNSPRIDPHETFANVTQQIYGAGSQPTMLGFLQNFSTLLPESEWTKRQQDLAACLETYTEDQLPVTYALSRHYAVSDSWFASVPTQTNPNRAFAACGTSEGQINNGPWTESTFYSDTIWNLLEEKAKNTSWMIFWQADMLPGIILGPFTGPNNFKAMERIPNLESHYDIIDGFHARARNGTLPAFSFLEPEMTVLIDLSALIPSLDGLIGPYTSVGCEGNEMHPPADVRCGENFLANIYTSLIANQEAWNKTLLVITFDEHGGLFDHVPPPAAVPPDGSQQFGFSFNRYGVRVPAIFVSPLIQQSTVVRSASPTLPFDHTSLISTILDWLELPISEWNMGNRVAIAPTFDTVLTLDQPRTDSIIGPERTDGATPVSIGDQLYLQSPDGSYVSTGSICNKWHAATGSDPVLLSFTGGSGALTHGSFALIQAESRSLGAANLLETTLFEKQCYFSEDAHSSTQWWTLKSFDYPYLGAPLCYGDKIFLENHSYLNVFESVVGRLYDKKGLFSSYLSTKPISDPSSALLYWTIVKPE